MAFPTTSALAKTLAEALALAGNIKEKAQLVHDRSNTGLMKARLVLDFSEYLANALDQFTAARDTPGIGAYAQAQLNDVGLDIAVEFNTMIGAVQSTISWIVTNVPQSGGYVQRETLGADGRVTQRVLTAAQTAGFRTELQALIATIA